MIAAESGPPDAVDTHPGPPRITGLTFDALILAGGRARRLGTPKPRFVLAGRTLLDHALDAAQEARVTVVVGPPELAAPDRYLLTREEPAFGGPVAGIAAGVHALAAVRVPAPWILVLACDVPRSAAAIPLLTTALAESVEQPDGVHVRHNGRDQWLLGIYARTALMQALDAVGPDATGAPVRHLMAHLKLITVEDADAVSIDIDTPEDAAAFGSRS